jgi:hypothetical protein
VKNESDYLHATQDPPAGHPAAPATAEPVIVHLPLYRPGSRVSYQGRDYTVGHVVISRSVLQVYLQELGNSVDAEKLQVSPTRMVLHRS